MPKKPRKTRIGSSAWAAQKAHDIAQNQTAKEQEKEKARGDRKRAHHNEQWQKERKEKQKPESQEQRQSWRQQTGSHHDPKRIACLRVLGLAPDKDNEESIKREYRRLSLLFHPDRNPSVSALEKMKAINNAFEYLMGKNL